MREQILQYVGARYVPILFNDGQGGSEWQPNTYYEPLTIVTYNNASYTSRQPVSASIGNPVENGEYWAMTGEFNAQFISVQEDIASIQSVLKTLAVSVKDYGAKGDGVTDDTVAIQKCIDEQKYGVVYFPPGKYIITSSLILHPLTVYMGDGAKVSTIRMTGGASGAVFKSFQWDEYRAALYPTVQNNNHIESFKGLSGSSFCQIRGLSIDGGMYGQDGATLRSSGDGIDFIGSCLTMDDVEVYNTPNVGIYIDTFNYNADWASANSYEIHLQSSMDRIEVHTTGNEGIIQKGLVDPFFGNLRLYKCCMKQSSGAGYSVPASFVMDGKSCSVSHAHIHGLYDDTYGILANTSVRFEFIWLMIEGGGNGILLNGTPYGKIDSLDFHGIKGVGMQGNGRITIANFEAYNMVENSILFKGGISLIISCGRVRNNAMVDATVFDMVSAGLMVNLFVANVTKLFSEDSSCTRGKFDFSLGNVPQILKKQIATSQVSIVDTTSSLQFDDFILFKTSNMLRYSNRTTLFPQKQIKALTFDNSRLNEDQEITVSVSEVPAENAASAYIVTPLSLLYADYLYVSDVTAGTATVHAKLTATTPMPISCAIEIS